MTPTNASPVKSTSRMKLLRRMQCFLVVLIYINLSVAANRHAATKTKLAEGEYGVTQAPKKPGNVGKAIDEWTLWKLPNGLLRAEVKHHWAGPARHKGNIEQTFTLTEKMELAGYELHVSGGGENRKLSCELKPNVISCTDGKTRGNLAVEKAPYSFAPGEFYGLDMPWYEASLIHSEINAEFSTPVYVLADSDSGSDSGIQVAPDVATTVKFLNKERISILGKQIDANKYELPQIYSWVWTAADSGMVLAVQRTDNGGRFELTKFKSNDPSFMPELS